MKKLLLTTLVGLGLATPAMAWQSWDAFKAVSVENARVIDHDDARFRNA